MLRELRSHRATIVLNYLILQPQTFFVPLTQKKKKKEMIWYMDQLTVDSYFQHTALAYCVLDRFYKFDTNFNIS